MHFSGLLPAVLASAAIAHPSKLHAHRHAHQEFHEKRDLVFYKAVKYTTVVTTVFATAGSQSSSSSASASSSSSAPFAPPVIPPEPTFSPEPTPPPEPTPNPTPTPTPSASVTPISGSSGSALPIDFVPFKCSSASKRASNAQNLYSGVVGTPYGCNILQINPDAVNKYDYTLTLENVDTQGYAVQVFNKMGPDGIQLGSWPAVGLPLKVHVPQGQKVAFAFQPGSIPIASFAPANAGSTDIKLSKFGQITGLWVEMEFASKLNGGWTGYDLSWIVADDDGQVRTFGGKVTDGVHPEKDSIVAPASVRANVKSNAYDSAQDKAVDGLGGNEKVEKAHLTALMGYNGN